MTLLAIFLVLLSAFLHALKNYFVKGVAIDKQVFSWCSSFVGLTLFLPYSLYLIFNNQYDWNAVASISFVSGFVHFLYLYTYTKAYETGDLSHVYPIMRSSPALVLLLAVIFLDEEVRASGVVGIFLVVIGAYIINLSDFSLKKILEPIRTFNEDPATKLAFITMLLVAIYSLIDKVGVGIVDPFLFSFLHSVVCLFFFSIYISQTKTKQKIKNELSANTKIILLNGCIVLTGYLFILYAFQISKVSYIVGFRQISVLIAVVMGGRLLAEGNQKIRLFSSALIFIGAVLIAISK